MIRNQSLYPTELRGRASFAEGNPLASLAAPVKLRGTKRNRAARKGTVMTHSRAHWSERRTIDPVSGCWVWTGPVNNNGYGKAAGSYVHRLSYVVAHGPIPADTEVDHLCRNRRCFNPDHLEAVSHQENMLRSPRTGSRTHCAHGHEYAKFGFWEAERGRKRCKECRRLRERPEFRPVDRLEIRRLRGEGLKGREIAKLTGASLRTVWRALAL